MRLARGLGEAVYLLPFGGGALPEAYLRPAARRVDIHVEVARVQYEKLASERQGETSSAVRERVTAARQLQSERFRSTRMRTNADIGPAEVRLHCELDAAARRKLMQAAMRQLQFSARLPPRAQAGPHDR